MHLAGVCLGRHPGVGPRSKTDFPQRDTRSGKPLPAIQIEAVPSALAGKFIDWREIAHTPVGLLSINVRAKRRDERKMATAGGSRTTGSAAATRTWIEVMT
jgi:hypothetical protein